MRAFSFFIYFVFISFLCSAKETCKNAEDIYQDAVRLYRAERYLLASIQFKTSSLFACEERLKDNGLFFYSLAMKKLGENQEALDTLQLPQLSTSDGNKFRIDLAKALLFSIDVENSEVKKRIEIWKRTEFRSPEYKSPFAAGLLSGLLPGAGHAYAGYWESAAYSFIINSLFLSAAIELQNKGLYSSSAVAWGVFSVTYVGSILSAVQTVNIRNNKLIEGQRIEAEKQQFPELCPQ